MAKTRGGVRSIRPPRSGATTPEEDWREVGNDPVLRIFFGTLKSDQIATAARLGMTEPEVRMIGSYTEGMYRPLNMHLYGREDLTGGKAAERLLNTALRKVPSYDGYVYHGQVEKYAMTYIRQLEKYGTFESEAFISASTEKGVAKDFSEGGIVFKIKSKTGKKLGKLSYFAEEEKEVLFRSKSRFKFIRKYKEDNIDFVEIEEI